MTTVLFAAVCALLLLGGCSGSPEKEAAPPRPTPAAAQAPPSPTVNRADELIEDLKRREAEFNKRQSAVQSAPPAEPRVVIETTPRGPTSTTPTPTMADLAPGGTDSRQSEAFWRGRLQQLQLQLDKDTRALADVRTRRQNLGDAARVGTSMLPETIDTIQRFEAEIARLAAVVAADQQALADLQEEGRRAGIPPGWLRP